MKFLAMLTLIFSAFLPFPAIACTLQNAQDNFSTLNDMFQSYTREIAEHGKRGEPVPAELTNKRTLLMDGTKAIRKLFAQEVVDNATMQSTHEINPLICDHYNAITKGRELDLKKIALAKEQARLKAEAEMPVCKPENMRKRFGNAVRKQRALKNAGKISKKEQIDYLNIAREIRENSKDNFDIACKALHQYEKKLNAEKTEKPEDQ